MGVKLIREVLDHAPADLASADMVVLLVLAEYARDDTRECWPGIDSIARRTRLYPDTLRKMFARWATRRPPLEVRVAAGKDKNGVPVFAMKGHRTLYRLPPFPMEGVPLEHAFVDKGVPPKHGFASRKGVPLEPQRRAAAAHPSSQEPSGNRHLARAREAIASLGADENETEFIIKKIKTEHQPRNINAYVAKLAETGDLVELLTEARGYLSQRAKDEAYRLGWKCRRCASPNRVEATVCRQCGEKGRQ